MRVEIKVAVGRDRKTGEALFSAFARTDCTDPDGIVKDNIGKASYDFQVEGVVVHTVTAELPDPPPVPEAVTVEGEVA